MSISSYQANATATYDRQCLAKGRAKRVKAITGMVEASARLHAKATRSGLALVNEGIACHELMQSLGMWASRNDVVRLSHLWFNAYYAELGQ